MFVWNCGRNLNSRATADMAEENQNQLSGNKSVWIYKLILENICPTCVYIYIKKLHLEKKVNMWVLTSLCPLSHGNLHFYMLQRAEMLHKITSHMLHFHQSETLKSIKIALMSLKSEISLTAVNRLCGHLWVPFCQKWNQETNTKKPLSSHALWPKL